MLRLLDDGSNPPIMAHFCIAAPNRVPLVSSGETCDGVEVLELQSTVVGVDAPRGAGFCTGVCWMWSPLNLDVTSWAARVSWSKVADRVSFVRAGAADARRDNAYFGGDPDVSGTLS